MDDNTLSFWMPIAFSPLISVASIFISNWLGRKSESRKFQLETTDKAYNSFYIPLMKTLVSANESNLTYYWFIAVLYGAPKPVKSTSDFLKQLLNTNLHYLPSQLIELIPKYNVATSGAILFFGEDGYRENYRQNLITASDLFDDIIEISLKEASLIANRLGYPDIAKPILESFLNAEKTKYNYPRYLPEIYQESAPNTFVGEDAPYY